MLGISCLNISIFFFRFDYLTYDDEQVPLDCPVYELLELGRLTRFYFSLPPHAALVRPDQQDIENVLQFIEGESQQERKKKTRKKQKKRRRPVEPSSSDLDLDDIAVHPATLSRAAMGGEGGQGDRQGVQEEIDREKQMYETALVMFGEEEGRDEGEDEGEGEEESDSRESSVSLQSEDEEITGEMLELTIDEIDNIDDDFNLNSIKNQDFPGKINEEVVSNIESHEKDGELDLIENLIKDQEETLVHQKEMIEELIETKSFEMRKILESISNADDKKQSAVKAISDNEAKIVKLKLENVQLAEEKDNHVKSKEKFEIKKQKLETYLDSEMDKYRNKKSSIETKILSLRSELETKKIVKESKVSTSPRKTSNHQMQKMISFLDKSIAAKERELECPLCLEVFSKSRK